MGRLSVHHYIDYLNAQPTLSCFLVRSLHPSPGAHKREGVLADSPSKTNGATFPRIDGKTTHSSMRGWLSITQKARLGLR